MVIFENDFDNRCGVDTFDGVFVSWEHRYRKSDYFNDLAIDGFACQNVSEKRLYESIAEYERMNDWN